MFGGRVKSGSVKNFILIENRDEPEFGEVGNNLIVFGKIVGDIFSL